MIWIFGSTFVYSSTRAAMAVERHGARPPAVRMATLRTFLVFMSERGEERCGKRGAVYARAFRISRAGLEIPGERE
jgi:hypothetical protein